MTQGARANQRLTIGTEGPGDQSVDHSPAETLTAPTQISPSPGATRTMTSPRGKAGKATYRVMIMRDVTATRELDRAKNEFVALASHELRTPLTSIKNALQLLTLLGGMAGGLSDDQERFLRMATRNTDRLSRLVSDILDVSRIGSGKVHLNCSPTDVRGAVERVVETQQRTWEAKRLGVAVTIPDALPLVAADVDRLEEILSNLLENAFKFTPESGRIGIEAREISRGDLAEQRRPPAREEKLPGIIAERFVQISVSDSGPGILPSDLERIFERFYQTESAFQEAHQGTGLGLAIARGLVEGHGGTIWVESQLDKGSRFTFVIPVAGGPGTGGETGEEDTGS